MKNKLSNFKVPKLEHNGSIASLTSRLSDLYIHEEISKMYKQKIEIIR